eukprot:TRINITY_DN13828_c0_g1_i14.p2 TRINITY_DN13828_c0_g1~~TRINITY_DN13828_c0_g1_i14.p2  ORF type:complete len:261 (+),score=34.42 TRINITY_DN13828_c0_g1_i14:1418-2200(+)
MDVYNAGSLLDAGKLPSAERPLLLTHCTSALRALKRLFWSHGDVHAGNVLVHRDQHGPRFALADMGRCSPSSTASTHFDAWCLGICGAFASGLATPRGAAQLAPGVVPWERMYEQCQAVRDAAVAVLVDDEVSRVVIALLDGTLRFHTAGVGDYEDPLHPGDSLSDAPQAPCRVSEPSAAPPSSGSPVEQPISPRTSPSPAPTSGIGADDTAAAAAPGGLCASPALSGAAGSDYAGASGSDGCQSKGVRSYAASKQSDTS